MTRTQEAAGCSPNTHKRSGLQKTGQSLPGYLLALCLAAQVCAQGGEGAWSCWRLLSYWKGHGQVKRGRVQQKIGFFSLTKSPSFLSYCGGPPYSQRPLVGLVGVRSGVTLQRSASRSGEKRWVFRVVYSQRK